MLAIGGLLFALLPAVALAQFPLASRAADDAVAVPRKAEVAGMGRLNQKISLSLEAITVEEALHTIARMAGLQVFYPNVDAIRAPIAAIHVEDAGVLDVLYEVTRGTNLRMKISGGGHLIVTDGGQAPPPVVLPVPEPSVTVAALYMVSGVVRSAQDGMPLPGVNVYVKNTTVGTTTDLDGRFSVDAPSATDTLVFSFIGFVSQEVPIEGRSTLDISLREDNVALDEVVVVGYGTQVRRDITGSVSSVRTEDVAQLPISSVNQALAGRVPGVQVATESGRPGSGLTIRIRGGNSLQGNNNPLYVIDGFPVSGDNNGGGDFQNNPLSSISPQDIEDIQILKDASATAIYGARGSNGVVLITTKRGRMNDQMTVSFDAYYGTQQEIGYYEMASPTQWAEMWNERYRVFVESGSTPPHGPLSAEEVANATGTDWHDMVVGPAPLQNYQLAVSGGTPTLRYYASGTLFNQDGIIEGSGFDRGSLKLNLNGERGQFKFGNALTYTRSTYTGAFGNSAYNPGGGGYLDLYMSPPLVDPYTADGAFNQVNPFSSAIFRNPLELTESLSRDQVESRFLASVFGEYELMKNLAFRVQVGADIFDNNLSYYEPTFTAVSQLRGQATRSSGSGRTYLNENTLTYTYNTGGAHRLNAVVGTSYQKYMAEGFSADASGFNDDVLGPNNLSGGQQDLLRANAYENEWKLLSLLGRANYSYLDRYLVTFTGRYDGSSRFGSDQKWAFFPSVALAWRLSQEPFMQSLRSTFDDLKVRASYGATGSTAIGPYQTLSRVVAQGGLAPNGLSPSVVLYPSQLGNPSLRWETTRQLDIGLDATLLDGRLTLSADYFNKKTTDLLLGVDLPLTISGLDQNASLTQNVGSLRNQGIEFSIEASPVQAGFSWNTGFNITYLKNEITDLGLDAAGNPVDSLRVAAPLWRTRWGGETLRLMSLGDPFGSYYLYKFAGILQNEAEKENLPDFIGLDVGEAHYVDTNGDGVVNADDRVIMGNSMPDFIGGFRNDFSYKGFDLSVFMEFSLGAQVFNATRSVLEDPQFNYGVTKEYAENYWRGEGTSDRYPMIGAHGSSMLPSDRYLENADYLRLRSLTLGYTLPANLSRQIGAGRLRVYLNATNLWTVTGYSGVDPDVNSFAGNNFLSGFDFTTYPVARTFTAGVNLVF